MKHPKYWFDLYKEKVKRGEFPDQIRMVEEVQLDAWAQGMTDAAILASNTVFKQILKARNKKVPLRKGKTK